MSDSSASPFHLKDLLIAPRVPHADLAAAADSVVHELQTTRHHGTGGYATRSRRGSLVAFGDTAEASIGRYILLAAKESGERVVTVKTEGTLP